MKEKAKNFIFNFTHSTGLQEIVLNRILAGGFSSQEIPTLGINFSKIVLLEHPNLQVRIKFENYSSGSCRMTLMFNLI